jgi:hypothetical protein
MLEKAVYRLLNCLLILLAFGTLAVPRPVRAADYDRADRARRVARGEQLIWNTLDDFIPCGAADPAYQGSSIYSWAACMQMVFALAGYETRQAEIIQRTFGDDWRAYSARNINRYAYSGVSGSGNRELYFSGSTAPGRLPYQTVIQCIDQGHPVVLAVDTGQGRAGDPLADYRRGGARMALVHGYVWDTDPATLVRTLWLDVYDPLPPDGAAPQSVRVPYNRLAKAWAATLVGTLDNTDYRLGVSQLAR